MNRSELATTIATSELGAAAIVSTTDTIEVVESRLDRLSGLLAREKDSAVQSDDLSQSAAEVCELSIVMPCLDEADTVGTCVKKAQQAIAQMGIVGEVVVADNGSRDGSVQIAESLGARVVHVKEPGYGAALMGGIEGAKGRFILMGDADDSYDFTQAPAFYEKLCAGADLVQGCRLPSGGGTIEPGAMPWLH